MNRHPPSKGMPAMPTNVEIKARVQDEIRFRLAAEAVSDTPCQVIPQEDVFFITPRGRLKLRILGEMHGQLIYYERPDSDAPKRSDYFIHTTDRPAELQDVLAKALGVRGTVRKTRSLYLVGNTRIHLDQVEGLGTFMELEVMLADGQSVTEGEKTAAELMARLGVAEQDLIRGAYMDLLEGKV